MPRMKISGPTQGKLVFAYDIRGGHIDYTKLIPALNKRLVQEGIETIAEEKELDDMIGEILFRCNEKIFEGLVTILHEKKYDLDVEQILDEAIGEVFKK